MEKASSLVCREEAFFLRKIYVEEKRTAKNFADNHRLGYLIETPLILLYLAFKMTFHTDKQVVDGINESIS